MMTIRELSGMMSAKFSDFLPPLSAFGSDLYYELYATSVTTSTDHYPSDADIISGCSLMVAVHILNQGDDRRFLPPRGGARRHNASRTWQ